MKKIVLDVDALRVTSFEALPQASGERGTVKGHATIPGCNSFACPTREYGSYPCATCVQGSCADSCMPPTGVPCYAC